MIQNIFRTQFVCIHATDLNLLGLIIDFKLMGVRSIGEKSTVKDSDQE